MTDHVLADLGWSDFFADQLPPDTTPARISAVHRDRIAALCPAGTLSLSTPEQTGKYAVGDWVLYENNTVTARLDRRTTIGRRAAGEVEKDQLIAANVDTLAIVTSCNADFNPSRIERYLALCSAGGATPLVILTKADLCADPAEYRTTAEAISPMIKAITINAHDFDDVQRLAPWCGPGQTLALVGSSGVGKTTIQNVLTGIHDATQDIRDGDAKGRHTTTSRALRRTLAGGWLIDTPGMRELRLTDVAEGIETVFSDLAALSQTCKFNDCSHEFEPGCAVLAAIAAGTLDPDRLARWQKLEREDRSNTQAKIVANAKVRCVGKVAKAGKARGNLRRGNFD